MKHILETCRKHKVPAGLHCLTAEEAKVRIEEGWQFIAIASELRMMLNAAANLLQQFGARQQGDVAKY